MAPQRKGIKHEYMRDRGGPPAAWQGPQKNSPEPQDSTYGYVRNRPSARHFKLIVDD